MKIRHKFLHHACRRNIKTVSLEEMAGMCRCRPEFLNYVLKKAYGCSYVEFQQHPRKLKRLLDEYRAQVGMVSLPVLKAKWRPEPTYTLVKSPAKKPEIDAGNNVLPESATLNEYYATLNEYYPPCQCGKRRKGHYGPYDRWICHQCANVEEQRQRKYIISHNGVVLDDTYRVDISGKTNRGRR